MSISKARALVITSTALLFAPLVTFATTAITPSAVPNGAGFSLSDPLNSQTLCGLIKQLLQAVLVIGVPVAVLFLVWAGFLFVWAQGNPTKLQRARKNLMYVLIGIGIFLGAWTLGQMIAGTLKTVVSASGQSTAGLTSCN